MGTTLVIWNTNAGSAASALAVREELERRSDIEIVEPANRADAESLVRRRCTSGIDLVVAAGGDGTINSVVNGLSEAKDVILGILPMGTANDWCSSLAIPHEPAVALDILDRGEVRRLDIAEVRTRQRTSRFANIATGGNSHRVTESLTDELKQRWGPLCYVRGALGTLADLDTFDARVGLDGDLSKTYSVWNIMVANGRMTAGGLEIAPRATLEDGLLDIVIVQSGTILDLADLSARYLFGEFIDSEQVIYRQARQITIESNPPIFFTIDGDVVDQQPACFRTLPRTQKVIVGPNFGREGRAAIGQTGR